jgi:predicted transcriptional regulator
MEQKNYKATVCVSLSLDTVEGIDGLATERQRTRSAMFEIILNEYLDVERRRAAECDAALQEAYQSEHTDEEAREIFFKVVQEIKDFDSVFAEMGKYEHVQARKLFITLINQGWIKYVEKFHQIRLCGFWKDVGGGHMEFTPGKIDPEHFYQLEDFPFPE